MNDIKPFVWGTVAVLTASCSLDMSRYPTPDASVTTVPSDGIVHLSIDTNTKYQTLEGFGAAVAWYAENLAGFPSDSPINNLAFRDLGLDILRFRNRYGRQDPNNSSDITAEAQILQRATVSLGHAPKVLLSSWSPPGSLKASGLENCRNSDPNNKTNCTLAKDASGAFVYDQFAAYFVSALSYYANAGIKPDYLSIQNESNFVPNGWEGCYFLPSESADFPGYDKALSAVQAALAPVSPSPKIIGPESYSLSNNVLDTFLVPSTRSALYGSAHHLYQSNYWRNPDSYLPSMTDAANAATPLPLFETEFDTAGDGNITGGFETAWVMHNSLAVEGVSAFLYWGLVWSGGPSQTPSGSLIWLSGNQFSPRDQYYSMRHFARFTDPGYVRVDTQSSNSDIRASAYLAPDTSQLTIVILNVGFSNAQVILDATNNFAASASEVYRTIFRTGDAGTSEYWTSLGGLSSNQSLTLPSHSVATLVLHSETPDAQ